MSNYYKINETENLPSLLQKQQFEFKFEIHIRFQNKLEINRKQYNLIFIPHFYFNAMRL